MRIFKILPVVVLSLAFLAGCGGPTIDASSEETFKASTESIMKSLDDAKKEQFEQALGQVMMVEVLFVGGDEAGVKKKMKEVFDGKSADEVIEMGKSAKSKAQADIEKMMN